MLISYCKRLLTWRNNLWGTCKLVFEGSLFQISIGQVHLVASQAKNLERTTDIYERLTCDRHSVDKKVNIIHIGIFMVLPADEEICLSMKVYNFTRQNIAKIYVILYASNDFIHMGRDGFD